VSAQTAAELPFPIERGKMREFARAVHAEADDGDEVIAPTFAITSMFMGGPEHSAREDDRDLARILHAEQEFVFRGPPPAAGTVLTAQQRRGPVWEKEGRRGGKLLFTQVDTVFRDSSGREVMESRFTTVTTSRAVTDGEGP
jgi:hypothetical protein